MEAIKEAEKLRYLKAEGLPELTDIFTDEGKMCVCMEMAEGMNLDSFLSVNEGFERKERKKIAGKIVQILSFLHGREVPLCHGDFTVESTALAKDGSIDFDMLNGCFNKIRELKEQYYF